MTYPDKNCAHCNNTFTPKRKDTKYCSHKCRMDAFKLREAQDIEEEQEERSSSDKTASALPARSLSALGSLDVASQYVINHQGETISELKGKISKLEGKNEKLIEEKRDLEKQITELNNTINQKPSALAGLIQSDKLPEIIMTGLSTVKEMFEARKNAPQIGAAPEQQQSPIVEWLSRQPMEVQNEFVGIIQELAQIDDAKKMFDTLQYLHGSVARVTGRRAM